MQYLVTAITSTGIFLVVYHHAWPVIGGLIARHYGHRRRTSGMRHRSVADNAAPPSVAVLIPAFNEENLIGEKLRNLAALDYPSDRLKILVVCDGCTDETASRTRTVAAEPECRHLDVTVREFRCNRGKLAILNEIIPTIDNDLVALTDAIGTHIDRLLEGCSRVLYR